jgi:acetylglutamate kinase
VRTELLTRLLEAGHTVVVSPISEGSDGDSLNVNADEAAAAIAAALGATELIFLTDVPGVRDAAGMRQALECGVAAVRIGDVQVLYDPAAGTGLHAVSLGAA